ncbi:hypothetical protein AAZV13_13G073700 [Glycine max]
MLMISVVKKFSLRRLKILQISYSLLGIHLQESPITELTWHMEIQITLHGRGKTVFLWILVQSNLNLLLSLNGQMTPSTRKRLKRSSRVFMKLFQRMLLPININPLTGTKSSGAATFGAMDDSFYEYLLKAWIHGNKTEVVTFYREMWEKSMKGLQSLIWRWMN